MVVAGYGVVARFHRFAVVGLGAVGPHGRLEEGYVVGAVGNGDAAEEREVVLLQFIPLDEDDNRLLVVVVLPREEGGDGQTFLSLCDRCADEQKACDEYFV